MIESIADKALNEYGLLVAVLLFACYILYKRNVQMGDKLLDAVTKSTRVLTEIKVLIREKLNEKDSK